MTADACIGDARREIMRFVEEEQRACRVEAGLFGEETAVAVGEDVIVIADPNVVERERGPGDLIGTDARRTTGGAQGGEIARVVFVEVETGEPALRPALGDAVQINAMLANAVKGVIDAVLGLVAHMPHRHRRRRGRRALRQSRLRAVVIH